MATLEIHEGNALVGEGPILVFHGYRSADKDSREWSLVWPDSGRWVTGDGNAIVIDWVSHWACPPWDLP